MWPLNLPDRIRRNKCEEADAARCFRMSSIFFVLLALNILLNALATSMQLSRFNLNIVIKLIFYKMNQVIKFSKPLLLLFAQTLALCRIGSALLHLAN